MSTTTYEAIRDNCIRLLEEATPYRLSQLVFRRAPRHREIRDWAPGVGSAALRKFQMQRGDGDLEEPQHLPPFAFEREETMLVTVAYPVLPALYGRDELDELECVMRQDATLVRDVLFAPTNYVDEQWLAYVTPRPPDRDDERCWFQVFEIRLIYSEAQSLT